MNSTFLKILVKWRKFVYLNVILVTVFAAVLCIVVPPKYTAVARFVPVIETEEQGGALASALSAMMGGAIVTPGDVYVDILKSRAIQEKVIKEFDLMRVLKAGNMDKAIKRFNSVVEFKSKLTGMVEISVTLKDPELAANVANALLQELDEFNRTALMTKGKLMRQFIESRLKEVEVELAALEDSLKKFEQTHKTVLVDDEVKAAIESYADLKATELSKEIMLDAILQVASKDHPQARQLEVELQAIRDKLRAMESEGIDGFGAGINIPFEKLPGVMLEYLRLKRDLEIKNKVYALLIEQYEKAKIVESRDMPTVQIIDYAKPPQVKSWPKRKLFVIASFAVSLIFSLVLVFVLELIDRIYTDPRYASAKALIDKIKGDLRL